MKNSRLFGIGFGGAIVLSGVGLAILSMTSFAHQGHSYASMSDVDGGAQASQIAASGFVSVQDDLGSEPGKLSLKETDLSSELERINALLGIDPGPVSRPAGQASSPSNLMNASSATLYSGHPEVDGVLVEVQGHSEILDKDETNSYLDASLDLDLLPSGVLVPPFSVHGSTPPEEKTDLSDGAAKTEVDNPDFVIKEGASTDIEISSVSEDLPARVEDGVFLEVKPEPYLIPGQGSSGSFLTPEILDRISEMDPEQIESLALLVSAGGGSSEFFEIMRERSLSRRDTRSTMGVPRLSNPGEKPESRVLDLSTDTREDERNILMRGWSVEEDTMGRVYVLRFNDPSSRIMVTRNMALGPFGRVLDIDRDDDEIRISLETGGTISGPVNPNRVAPTTRPRPRPEQLASRG